MCPRRRSTGTERQRGQAREDLCRVVMLIINSSKSRESVLDTRRMIEMTTQKHVSGLMKLDTSQTGKFTDSVKKKRNVMMKQAQSVRRAHRGVSNFMSQGRGRVFWRRYYTERKDRIGEETSVCKDLGDKNTACFASSLDIRVAAGIA